MTRPAETSGGRIVVLLGGPSAEHDVSLVSGRAIANALTARGDQVDAWLIDLEGAWWQLPETALDPTLPQTAFDAPAALGAIGPRTAFSALDELAASDPPPLVWIALHGPFGEDGTAQALCEAAGLAYTGAGVAASALGMDKVAFKRIAGGLGIPLVPWRPISATSYRLDPAGTRAELLTFAGGLPERRLIIKPSGLGSSVGIRIVHRPDDTGELDAALQEAFRYDESALAEAYLGGARELEVSVVGNDPSSLEVYGPGEVFPGHEFYDYEAKYRQGVSRTTDRPEISSAMRDTLRDLARATYVAIGASGFARVDFLVRDGRVYVSEINTVPGFTPISLFPVLCVEGGYDFGDIAARIVDLAQERHANRPRTRLSRADLP
jgi:D-alanine-D-alanine ligase